MKTVKCFESFEILVDLFGEVAVFLWQPDDLSGFSIAIERAVFAHGSNEDLIPLPYGVAEYLRGLAEAADAWPDADAVPHSLSFQ